jgi:hypothetical protein
MNHALKAVVVALTAALASRTTRGNPDASDSGCPDARATCEASSTSTVSLIGLRVSRTAHRRDAASDEIGSVLFAAESEVAETDGHTSSRVLQRGYIGGGSGGLEVGLELAWAAGLFLPLGEHHGLVARGGARAHLIENELWYRSSLELPVAQVGYHVATRRALFDAALTLAPSLTGRFEMQGADARKLSRSIVWGGELFMNVAPIGASFRFTRTEDQPVPVDDLAARVCGVAGHLGICFDARYAASELQTSSDAPFSRSELVTIGLSAGFGTSLIETLPARGPSASSARR